jgi:hypothetical protein
VETSDALALAQKMWTKIQTQRHSPGVDEPQNAPQGLHGYVDYYRGVHKLRFASDEFAKYHLARYSGFSDNWCAPVIDATAERLNTTGIRLGEDTREADREFQRIADANDYDRGLSEAVTVAMAAGRSYGLVWGNPADESTPRVTFEHPEFCTMAYDPDTREATAAAKAWFDDEDCGYLTLYTADQVWKWKWSVPKDADNRRQVTWEPRQGERDDTWPLPNPLGRVPMEEFRNTALLDDRPISDLSGVASMQDAVNLIWAYLFNGLDFATMDQRVVTGADMPKIPVLDAEGQKIGEKDADLKKLVTERILWLTGPTAKIESWPAANLDIFDRVIGTCVDHIAAQTRTPPHYLIGKMSNTSGDALTVAETGLVAKVVQRQANFTRPQRGMYQLMALATGDTARAVQARTGTIVWADPQYRSLSQKIDAFQKWRASGLPLRFLLEWYGLDATEVDRVMTMAETEANTLVSATPVKAPAGEVLAGRQSVELPIDI